MSLHPYARIHPGRCGYWACYSIRIAINAAAEPQHLWRWRDALAAIETTHLRIAMCLVALRRVSGQYEGQNFD